VTWLYPGPVCKSLLPARGPEDESSRPSRCISWFLLFLGPKARGCVDAGGRIWQRRWSWKRQRPALSCLCCPITALWRGLTLRTTSCGLVALVLFIFSCSFLLVGGEIGDKIPSAASLPAHIPATIAKAGGGPAQAVPGGAKSGFMPLIEFYPKNFPLYSLQILNFSACKASLRGLQQQSPFSSSNWAQFYFFGGVLPGFLGRVSVDWQLGK